MTPETHIASTRYPLVTPGYERQPGIRRISLDPVTDEGVFYSLRDEWNDLAGRSSATIFQTHEWLWLWWKHFGRRDNCQLYILVCRVRGEIVGIIPLFLEEHALAGLRPYRKLRLMGSGAGDPYRYTPVSETGPSDFLDFIALPEFESRLAEEFAGYLREHASLYDEMELEHIPDQSIVRREFTARMEIPGSSCKVRRTDVCPRLNVPRSMEEYLGTLHASVRRRFSQARRGAASNGGTSMETVPGEGIPETFGALIRLHQERWNRLGYPGLFSDERFLKFQEEVLQEFAPKGWLWFKFVRGNGSCVACRLGYTFNGRYYDYLSGFDDSPHWSKSRPGLALLLSMLEDATATGAGWLELLRGDEKYKFELTQDLTHNWTVHVVNPRTLHTVRYHLHRFLQSCRFIIRRGSKEFLLFRTQYRRHGAPRCFLTYASFRLKGFLNKIYP